MVSSRNCRRAFIDVEFSELTEEESKTIDDFINDYYSDGDFYENI